jgi:hypothetical protein
MYAAGAPQALIRELTEKGDDEVRRLVSRCVTPDGEGGIFGFRALIPGYRTRPYVRTSKVVHVRGGGSAGCSGALQQLLDRFPGIADLIDERLFKRASRDIIHEARISFRNLHRELKKQLRKLGLTDHDWPFNTSNFGYNALINYCKIRRDQDLARWIRVRSGADASRRSGVGTGYRTLIPVLRPLSQVQLDFHKVDAACVVILETGYGTELEIPLSRFHIGVAADEYSRAVLGAFIALESNPSADSVLETIESAIRPDITPELAEKPVFLDAKVLPNQTLNGLAFQGIGALKMDNAWSNTATGALNNIIDLLGCAVNFGPVRAWWRRALIERIFGALTRAGVQRLPSTHGSGPSDTRNEGANQLAVSLKIKLSELVQLISECIKEYNESPNEGLQFAAPLDVLRAALTHSESDFLAQPISMNLRRDLRLMRQVRECRVRGDLRKNARPYLQIDRCRYTNARLAHSYNLVGKTVVVYVDRRDCRIAHGTVKETGEELGALIPEQRWSLHRISVRDRQLINRSGLALRPMNETDDPVAKWGETKKSELIEQRKGKNAKLKSSKEGLRIARMESGLQASADSSPTSFATHSTTLPPDPFGLSTPPQLNKSTWSNSYE